MAPAPSRPAGPAASGRAGRVADAVAQAWWASHAGSDPAIPLGVAAALALLRQRDPARPGPAAQIRGASDAEIAQLLREVWALFAICRPELAFRCRPFAAWLDEEPPEERLVAAAAAVARAAARAGLFGLTFGPGAAQTEDVLGFVYQVLRSERAKQAFGEMYTPASAGILMARMILAGSRPGQSICEPTAGTGGLILAAATALRQDGKDPHDYRWYACDISPVSVAALAVNLHLWDIGPHVVVGCADLLLEGDWDRRALDEQRRAVALMGDLAEGARLLAAVRALDGPARRRDDAAPGAAGVRGRRAS
jgi:hypothetical protein